jgi:Domain of unknown function (DUF4519)
MARQLKGKAKKETRAEIRARRQRYNEMHAQLKSTTLPILGAIALALVAFMIWATR